MWQDIRMIVICYISCHTELVEVMILKSGWSSTGSD